MTTTLYASQIETARRMIRAKGAVCTFTRAHEGFGYNPLTDMLVGPVSGEITADLAMQLAAVGAQIFSGDVAVSPSVAVAAIGGQAFSSTASAADTANVAAAGALVFSGAVTVADAASAAGVAAIPVPLALTSATLMSWFDASQMGLSNNGSVTTLTDFSGQGNHGTQSVSSLKALFKTNIQNGLPVVRYDGTDDYHLDPLVLAGAKTVMSVFKLRSLPGVGTLQIPETIATNGSNWSLLYFTNKGGWQPYSWRDDFTSAGLTVGLADALDISAHVLFRTYNGGTTTAPASYAANLDGVAKSVIASASDSNVGLVGAEGAVVASGTPSDAVAMDLMERCIYNGVLSAGDRTNLIAYARSKWATI